VTTRTAERRALHALAAAWGVQRVHVGNDGSRRAASDDALLAILNALGADLTGPRDARGRLADRKAALAARPIEPVLVAWDGRLPAVDVARRPGTRRPTRLRCELRLEDGTTCTHDLTLGDRPRPTIAFPEPLPLGVHRLVVDGTTPGTEATILSAPRRAWTPASQQSEWGVFAPLYALGSRESLGVGDFGDLGRLAEWVGREGGHLVGTLPLLAAFLDEPYEPSPYAPVSRLFWNELYLDLAAIPELADAPDVRDHLASMDTREAFARLRRGRLVDARGAMREKRRLLERLAETPRRPDRERAFEAFLTGHPQVMDYARFRATVETRGTTWPDWRGVARAGRLSPRDVDRTRARYHAYVQWIADDQLRRLGERTASASVGLYLDLPLGVHGGGFDTWRERDAFALGVDAGAPPDAFFQGGQAWGFPPLQPERVRAAGYRYPLAYLRHHMHVAGVLRIDHVMGLHRLYWVPHGFPPTDGAYVRQRADEAYALVTLESHRNRCVVVGENLGTVPAEVDAAMERHGLLRMHVLQFAIDPDGRSPLSAPPRASLASINTHDLPPFAGWWAERDLDDAGARGLFTPAGLTGERRRRARERSALVRAFRRAGLLGSRAPTLATVLRAALRHLGSSRAAIVLTSLDDLWLETAPHNVPGTTGGANWRRRLRFGLERITRDARVRALLRDLRAARRLRDATTSEE